MSLGELAKKYENLVLEKKRTADTEKILGIEISQVERDLLEEMGLNGIDTLKTSTGTVLYRRKDRIVSKADGVSTDQLCHELAQHEQTRDLVCPRYNANSLSSRWKEMIESDDPVPPSLAAMLKIIEIDRIGYRT